LQNGLTLVVGLFLVRASAKPFTPLSIDPSRSSMKWRFLANTQTQSKFRQFADFGEIFSEIQRLFYFDVDARIAPHRRKLYSQSLVINL